MNKEWSELNKAVQTQLKKEPTFSEGISTLLELRQSLMKEMEAWKAELKREDFYAIPFLNAKGYHCKTIAYSLWHIFRIEDIVAHSLILGDSQVFFQGNYQKKTGAPIITTGNELFREEIAEFSRLLDLDALYEYIREVKSSTEAMLKNLAFPDLKRKMTDGDRESLESLHVVSPAADAVWLIDYWCGKDVRGLIQMPFSRHWIMHVEAALRIRNKLCGGPEREAIRLGGDTFSF